MIKSYKDLKFYLKDNVIMIEKGGRKNIDSNNKK